MEWHHDQYKLLHCSRATTHSYVTHFQLFIRYCIDHFLHTGREASKKIKGFFLGAICEASGMLSVYLVDFITCQPLTELSAH